MEVMERFDRKMEEWKKITADFLCVRLREALTYCRNPASGASNCF